jgi:hypothetical protein
VLRRSSKLRARQRVSVASLVKQLPKRGKGSHTIWAVTDADGNEVARLALTGHAGAMTPTVTRSVEQAGEPAFGKGWLDK